MYCQPAVVFIYEIDSLFTQRKSDENEASHRIKKEYDNSFEEIFFFPLM